MLNVSSGAEGVANACRVAGLKVLLTSRSFVEKAKPGPIVDKVPAKVFFLEDLRPQFTLLDKLWLILWAKRHPRRDGPLPPAGSGGNSVHLRFGRHSERPGAQPRLHP